MVGGVLSICLSVWVCPHNNSGKLFSNLFETWLEYSLGTKFILLILCIIAYQIYKWWTNKWFQHLHSWSYFFLNVGGLLQIPSDSFWRFILFIVRRAGLLWSQQDFEWRWSVPLFKCLTVLEFSFILFDLCLLITFFNFIMNYVPIVTFWIFTYHKIWILSIMFCFIWSYWIIYFLACL